MNVCLVSQEYPPETGGGGIGTQTFLKAHGLVKLGHTVHVVSCSHDGAPRTYLDGEVVIHRIRHPASDSRFSEPSVHWVAYSWAVANTIDALRDHVGFDLIEFPDYGAEGFIHRLETTRSRGVPLVVGLHGPLAMFAEHVGWPAVGSEFYRFGTFMEEVVVGGADLRVAYSHNIARFWSGRHGISLGEIEVVHTAVDANMFAPPKVERGEGRTVLFVGRIDAHKGVFAVAEAVDRLRRRHPKILLRIVGGGDEAAVNRLREMLETGMKAHVEFVGRVPYSELPEHYAGCDVFASPATHEPGVASVYLEAMSCGKPVVACDTGGAPEAVVDGRTGLLVPPGDGDALEHALDRLLTDGELRDRLGRNGRKMVLEYFSIDKHIARVEAAYKRLLARGRT
jgi:glycosyltransferase involved in cell wall biosynthesis